MQRSPSRFEDITTVMLDVDGVLSDGFVLAVEDGEPIRRMHIKDGFALQHAVKQGVRLCIISGGKSLGVKQRLERLGVTDITLGAAEKLPVYEALKARHNLQDAEILYMGDDLPDYTVMQRAGLACAPADAAHDILEIADYIAQKPGGHGCVREVLEKLLKAQGKWFTTDVHQW